MAHKPVTIVRHDWLVVGILVVMSEADPPVIKLPARAVAGGEGADIVIPGAGASSCVFEKQDETFHVRRLSGTLKVNGKVLESLELVDNDELELGDAHLKYKDVTRSSPTL